MAHWLTALVVLAMVATTPAGAVDIDAETKCPLAVEAFDDEDRAAIRTMTGYIASIMRTVDLYHVKQDEPSAIDPLNERGFNTIVVMAVMHCQDHPDQTVQEAAIATYIGHRVMQTEFGNLGKD